MPEFYVILAGKIIKIPDFLLYLPEKFAKYTRKMPEFYITIARKIFFPNFRGLGGTCPPLPPVSYAYEKNCTDI